MSKKTLTEIALRAAPPPASGRLTLWDSTVQHFGVRITPAGVKTFIVLLGSGRRLAIGRYPVLSLAQAREKAKRILAERTLGRHQTASVSWQTAVQKFIDTRRGTTRPGTLAEYERTLKRYFGFGTTRLSDISKQDISGKLEKLNRTPSQKAHALVIVKMFFRWALVQGFVDIDPTASFKRARQRKRRRVLTDAELRSVWRACVACSDSHQAPPEMTPAETMPRAFAAIVQLLILLGQRRSETAALRRSWLANDIVTLPADVTKNGREHALPIGPSAQSVLAPFARGATLLFPARGRADRPFNGWSKSKVILDKLSGVTNWRLHDLRRTFRTIHARIGTPPHVAERLLNHVNAVASEVEQTYDLHTYLPEMRQAMLAYEAELARIFTQETVDRRAA
jgi:integrase